MKLFCLIVSLLILPFVVVCQTTTNYYVSDTGSDTNPGTAAQPFRTVGKCVSKFDDTTQVICNCAGTFNEEIAVTAGGPSVERRSKITAWDTDGDGLLTDETFVFDGQGTRNETIKAVTGARPDNIEIAWAVFRNYDPDGGCNIIDDGELHFIKLVCWGNGGCADWWIHNNVFEKLGRLCNVESHYIAIQPSDAPRLIVENNRFDSVGGFIMRYVGGTGIKFRNNHVLIHGTGIKAWDDPDSIEITGNVFECDGNGINRPGSTSCGGQSAVSLSNNVTASQIKDNVFVDCLTAINIATDNRYGEKNNGPHLIEGNRIYQSSKICNRYAPAIEISDNSDTTIHGDSIHVFGVTIRNNVIAWVDSATTNLGTAFSLSAGHPFPFESDIRIYNNTVRSFGRGLLLSLATKSGVPFPYQLNGVDVRNNVFNNIKDEYMTLAGVIASWPDSGRALNWNSDYNVYSGRDRITWGGTRYTLAQWKVAKGEDAHSRIASPTFIADSNLLQPLLKLAATDTVALNRGTGIAEVMTDFSRQPRPMGGAWEIGAHEAKDKRIYYASDAGSDSYLGTADQPFRTLQRGVDLWNGTDQFELRGAGTFSEEVVLHHGGLNADSLNQILPWDTDSDGSLTDETFVLNGGDSLMVAFRTDTSDAPDYVRMRGLTFRNYASSDCDSLQEVRFLRLKGNPADNLVGWRIEENSFLNLSADCGAVGRRGALQAAWVRDLHIESNQFDSIGGFILNTVQSENIRFAENSVRLTGYGIKAGNDVDSMSVVDNVFIGDGNGAGPASGECKREWGVELVNGVRHGLISGNTFYGSSGGVMVKTNANGTRDNAHHVIEKNRIYLNDEACNPHRSGILISDVGDVPSTGDSIHVEDVLIRNNVIAFDGEVDSSGAGIKLVAGHPYPFTSNIRIYNNTVAGFTQGLKVMGGEDSNGTPWAYQLKNIVLKNNLFSGIGDAQIKFESDVFEAGLPTGWESDYNVYGGEDRFRWKGQKSLVKWRSKTGKDLHSAVCNADFISGDTLFHLSNTDACAVNNGVTLSEVVEDIDGDSRPNGVSYDVGADERITGMAARVVARPGEEFTLESSVAISPNPVIGIGTIRIDLSEAEVVSIKIYDGRGEEISRPVDGLNFGPGRHLIQWDTQGVPAGLYRVKVERASGVIQKNLVVLE